MLPTSRSRALSCLFVLLMAPLAGCESPADPDTLADTGVHLSVTSSAGLHFLTQDVDPPILMDALYRGELSSDAAGCIRLGGPESAAVVWPAGFGVRGGPRSAEVLRPDGSVLGVLEGGFEFGGGFVQDLHDGLGFDAVDRELARSRCPGSYWIVGEVPAPDR